MRTIGIDLITQIKRNMKLVQHSAFDAALLRKRFLIETVFDELKNLTQIEHTRYRLLSNFIVNLPGGIVSYCLMPQKSCLPLQFTRQLDLDSSFDHARLIPN